MTEHSISITVNGEKRTGHVEARKTLAELRERFPAAACLKDLEKRVKLDETAPAPAAAPAPAVPVATPAPAAGQGKP